MKIVDVTNDAGFATLKNITQRFPNLTEFCKTAELGREEFGDLPEESFAWQDERKFPIHTPEHTALSVGYAKYASDLPQEVKDKLSWAEKSYGLSADLYQQKEQVKTASVRYLHEEKKRFQVKTASDVKFAEKALLERKSEFRDPAERTHLFSNLVKAAQDHGVELEPRSLMLGGQTVTDVQTLRNFLDVRAEMAKQAESPLEETYRKMADSFGDTEGFIAKRELQTKLATTIHELDTRAGLTHKYNKAFPDPVVTVFNTEKVAQPTVNIAGVPLRKEVVAQLPPTFWTDALGPEITREISKEGSDVDIETLQQVMKTLPADLKSVVANQLRAYA